MDNLRGKTAFITGGASGIGLGIARACGEEGMNIVIVDLRQQAIDEALPIFEEKGWPVMGIKLDTTNREEYVKAADAAEAKFGKIHLLVNNAGIGGAHGPLWDVSAKDTDFAINVNLFGVLNGIQAILPRIIAHGEGGHVVSTASKAGLIPVPNCGLYNVTKSAVIGITETLATDLMGTNVGASVLCPGPFQSNLGQSSRQVQEESLGEKLPEMERPEPPKDAPPIDITTLFRDPLDAGRRVVRGVKRGDIYILTHSDFKDGFVERAKAIERAFPDEPVNKPLMDAFPFLMRNPVFETQTQVPAMEK